MDVEDYIRSKSWAIQKREKSGREIILSTCPLCGKGSKGGADRNFYINTDSSVWVTNCCQRSGNLLTLKREMGDLLLGRAAGGKAAAPDPAKLPHPGSAEHYQRRLWSEAGADALEWLRKVRCFTDATIKRAKFGLARRGHCKPCDTQTSLRDDDTCPFCSTAVERARDMVAIPYLRDGVPISYKFRSYGAEKRFESYTGAPSELFNRDALRQTTSTRVVITEAEFDAWSLEQLGISPVVSLGGAGKELADEWRELLARFDDVVIAYDNDEAGDKGALDHLVPQLGRYRCRRARFPLKDANECLAAGLDPDEIRLCVEAAEGYRLDKLRHASSFKAELLAQRARGVEYGSQTRWLGLNRLLRGYRPGEVTVVTGRTGSGKSSFTTDMALDQAKGAEGRAMAGVFVASFEMSGPATTRKMAGMNARAAPGSMSDEDYERAIDALAPYPIYVYDHYGRLPLSDLKDAIEFGVRRYGIKFIVLDHLHFFLDISNPDYERHDIQRACEEIKNWAGLFEVHVVLVVHPGKQRFAGGKPLKVQVNDLRGASAIEQTADNIVRVWKPTYEELQEKKLPSHAEVAVLKARHDDASEGAVLLAFDDKGKRFEYDPNLAQEIADIIRKARRGGRRIGGRSAAAAAAGDDDGDEREDQQEMFQ